MPVRHDTDADLEKLRKNGREERLVDRVLMIMSKTLLAEDRFAAASTCNHKEGGSDHKCLGVGLGR